ncbi:hypothetical protein Gohar_006766 [Gossypium harknessii]|uniref:DUF4283 domain-containing protein n=1 Tax=Gossypium harknessii TaxID=34285 RepID=A0A7J9GEF3_9ROSI|nr:hypothetical protein [Gossypium harknessii]
MVNNFEALSNVWVSESDDSNVDSNTKKVRFKYGSDDSMDNIVVDTALVNELHGRIKKHSQPFRIIHVANGYYLVLFHNSIDYNTTLTQGPWIVFGHYLIVQPWTMDFNTLQHFPNMVLAWIRFLGLSGFLYKKQILEEIGSLVSGNSHSGDKASPSLMNSDQFWCRLEKPTVRRWWSSENPGETKFGILSSLDLEFTKMEATQLEMGEISKLAFAREGSWTGFEGFRSWTDGARPRMDLEECFGPQLSGGQNLPLANPVSKYPVKLMQPALKTPEMDNSDKTSFIHFNPTFEGPLELGLI